jgi:hypothetical protein
MDETFGTDESRESWTNKSGSDDDGDQEQAGAKKTVSPLGS